MPKFTVYLESQTDDQRREVTSTWKNAVEARAYCEEKERDYCAYKLEDDEVERFELQHRLISEDEATLDGRMLKAGKVIGPDPRTRARLHAHHQSKPYKVVNVERVGE